MKKLTIPILVLTLSITACSTNQKYNGSENRFPASVEETGSIKDAKNEIGHFDADKFDHALDDQTQKVILSAEDLKYLESMREKVKNEMANFNTSSDEVKQTKLGKVATAVGKGMVGTFSTINEPFLFTGSFLRGYFEKKEHVDQKTQKLVEVWLNKALNWAKNEKEEVAEKLITRMMNGEALTRGEMKIIIALVPELQLDDTDMIYWVGAWSGGKYLIPLLIVKALAASAVNPLKTFVLRPLLLLDLGALVSVLPCMDYDPDPNENPITNKNLNRYCQETLELLEYQTMSTKIKGYLKGRNAKRKYLENKAAKEE